MQLTDFGFLYHSKSFRSNCRLMYRFADSCIEKAFNRAGLKSTTEKSHEYVFLEELIKLTDNQRETRSQLLNILLAGRDTTAGLLSWTFWLSARYPDVLKRPCSTALRILASIMAKRKSHCAAQGMLVPPIRHDGGAQPSSDL